MEATIWYNDEVIYPDKVRLNCYYYNHYSLTCGRACSCSAIGKQACHFSRLIAAFFCQKRVGKDGKQEEDELIFATVLGKKVRFWGEER